MRKLVLLSISLVLLSGFATAGWEPAWPADGHGNYINIKLGGSSDDTVWQFHFTDKPNHQKYDADGISGRRKGDPYIFVSDSQNAGDDFGVYVLKKGAIIEGESTKSFADYVKGGCIPDGVSFNNPYYSKCTDKVQNVLSENFDGGGAIKNKCGDDTFNNEDANEYPKSCTLNYGTGTSENQDGDMDGDKDENQGIHQAYTLFGQSEIIVAAPGSAIDNDNPADHSGSGEYHEYDFFLCDSSGNYNPGKVVYAYDDESSQLRGWECTSDGPGLWEKLPQCNDGINNDDDEGIDHPDSDHYDGDNNDPECSYPQDNSESNKASCTPVIAKRVNNAGDEYLAAVYGGGQDSEGQCTGGEDGEYETGFPHWRDLDLGAIPDPTVYGCNSEVPSYYTNLSDTTTTAYNYGMPSNSDGIGICSRDARDYYRHDERPSEFGKTVYVAEYYPETDYISYLSDGLVSPDSFAASPENTKRKSKFVDNEGWTPAYMGLDGHSGFGEDSVFPAGAERQYGYNDGSWAEGRHSEDFWFRTIGLADPSDDGYAGSQMESWLVANAGSDAGGNISDSEQFPGGWYGNCLGSNNTWAPDSEAPGGWSCNKTNLPTETIEVNFYNDLGGSGSSAADKLAGFQINGSEMEKWEEVFDVDVDGGENYGPVYIRAQCWQGAINQRPENNLDTGVFNISAEAEPPFSGPAGTTYVAGKLPENPSLSATSNTRDKYSCIWGFQQRFNQSATVPTGAKLYYDGYQSRKPRPNADTGYQHGYLISGTNAGPIQTSYSSINPRWEFPQQGLRQNSPEIQNSDMDTEYIGSYEIDGKGSGHTLTGEKTVTDPWIHYPDILDANDPDRNIDLKHPGGAWLEVYG